MRQSRFPWRQHFAAPCTTTPIFAGPTKARDSQTILRVPSNPLSRRDVVLSRYAVICVSRFTSSSSAGSKSVSAIAIRRGNDDQDQGSRKLGEPCRETRGGYTPTIRRNFSRGPARPAPSPGDLLALSRPPLGAGSQEAGGELRGDVLLGRSSNLWLALRFCTLQFL